MKIDSVRNKIILVTEYTYKTKCHITRFVIEQINLENDYVIKHNVNVKLQYGLMGYVSVSRYKVY